jgi:cytochrome c oxidase subunit 2
MTYVIAQPWADVKDKACVEECPVDCIYEGERSLYIHPDECVDCGASESVCPVEAIFYADDTPEQWKDYYKANVEFFDDLGSSGGAAKLGMIPKGRWLVTDYRRMCTLPRPDGTSARLTRRVLLSTTLSLSCALALSGCGESVMRGLLPQCVTSESGSIIKLWTGSWLAALGVGVLVWGLIGWCAVAYRRKKDDVGLPEQLRYNVPIEILYTVVPVFMVAVLFFYTARLESSEMDVSAKPDVTINVVAKQWNWDFNYIDAGTFESSTMVMLTGQPGVAATLPALYLPVNRRVEFVLTSRDVGHSFWVPQFLRKLDVIPGKANRFQVVPTEIGVFQGKCAELCGEYHSNMLFQVKVVSQADYQARMADLRAKGNIGMLSNSLSREQIQPGQQQYLPTNGSKS